MARRTPKTTQTRSARPGASRRSPNPATAWMMVALAAVTLWIYAPVWHFGFVTYDDADFVTANPGIMSGFTRTSLSWILENPYFATGGPITWLSHVLDIELFGLQARGHHVTSLLIHVVNGCLLFAVLKRLTGAVFESAFVAALFAVHPIHVESVAWVSQRKDVVSTFFFLLTLRQYQTYVLRPSAWRYAGVLGLFVAGLMSKPVVATLPLTLLVLDLWPLGRVTPDRPRWPQWRFLLIEKLPFAALGAASLLLVLQSQVARGATPIEPAPMLVRLSNVAVSYAGYLDKLLWPTGLSAFYPYRSMIAPLETVVSLAVLVAISIVAFRLVRRLPQVLVGWLWYLGALIPVIGFVQVGGHSMADRLTYVPAIGVFIAVAWATAEAFRRWAVPRVVTASLVVVLLAALGIAARAQVWTWRDGESLWRHAIAVDPTNARALANLAATLAREGRTAEALPYYREAVRLTPTEPKLRNNLGLALGESGDPAAAIAEFREALRQNPVFGAAHLNLADQLAGLGQYDLALAHYQQAIQYEPRSGLARMNLAVTLAEIGRLDDAARVAAEGTAIEPQRADWRFTYAMMLSALGRRQDAIAQLEAVIRLEPGHTAARQELANLRFR